MKYLEFKNHFYKRAINEFGFVKEKKTYVYRNDEVHVLFDIDKSRYSNSVSCFGLGISPIDVLNHWKLDEPIIYEGARLMYPFGGGGKYINLDELSDLSTIDAELTEFFKNEFVKYTSIAGLKSLIQADKLYAPDYLKEFWFGKTDPVEAVNNSV